MHICPICGYDQLLNPPTNFTICPSCGTEFEYDDAFSTRAQLRAAWLRSGAKWWSPVDPEPPNWDPYSQLNKVIVVDILPIWTAALRLGNYSTAGGVERLDLTHGQPGRPSVFEMLGKPAQQHRTAQAG